MGPADGNASSEPLVSVVVPVYNRARLIGRALASVFAQTYRNFEIIVVDDASNDELGGALAEFNDTRLRCIAHMVNQGAAAARNTGVAAANGEFVAFLDSDDFWYPGKLAHQIAAMRGQPPRIAGHICAYDCVRAGHLSRRVVSHWTAESFGRQQLFGCYSGPGTTLLCRREVFAEVGPFDANLRRLEDWDWLLRLALSGRVLLASPDVLARVEVNGVPPRRDVEAAIERIRARHYTAVGGLGVSAQRVFEASLHLERASVAFADRAYAHAVTETLRSIAQYPMRGLSFYWRVLQRLGGETWLSLTQRTTASPGAHHPVSPERGKTAG